MMHEPRGRAGRGPGGPGGPGREEGELMGYGRRQMRRSARLAKRATVRGRFGRARKALVLAALAGLQEARETTREIVAGREGDDGRASERM